MELKFYSLRKMRQDADFGGRAGAGRLERGDRGTTEAAKEKHIPAVTVEGNTVSVNVGSVSHPMSAEHLIEWIAVETEKGYAVRYLTATDKPEAKFVLADGDSLKAVYAYCNLHGLWKA